MYQNSVTLHLKTKRSCKVLETCVPCPSRFIIASIFLGLVQVVAKMRSINHLFKMLFIACCLPLCLFFSRLLLLSWFIIVASPPTFSNGFIQFCTRLKRHNHLRQWSRLFLFSTSPARARLFVNSSPIILWWSVASMVSSVPILRIGTALLVLKERLASIQYLQNFSAPRTSLTLRSPSCTSSGHQKYLVSMCFVLGPALNGSARECAGELSLGISTLGCFP